MKKILLAVLTLILYNNSQAQPNYLIRHFDEDEGLAQRHVTQIVQSDDGFIWVGTWNGLDRYDGYEFVNFKSNDDDAESDFSSDRVVCIRKSATGNIWCLMDNQPYEFDVNTYHFTNVLDSLSKATGQTFFVNNILPQKDGSTVFTCSDGQIILVNDRTLAAKLAPEGYSYSEDLGESVPFPSGFDLKGEPCYSLTDQGGNLWYRTNYGIYEAIPLETKCEAIPEENASTARCALKDSQGRFWVSGSIDKTLKIYDGSGNILGYLTTNGRISKSFTRFGASIYSILQDSKGRIWLGSKPDGLFRLTPSGDGYSVENFKIDPSDTDINGNSFYDIKTDPLGRLWVATMRNGVNLVQENPDGSISFIGAQNGLSGYPSEGFNRTRSICFTSSGAMIVCTTAGILVTNAKETELSKMQFTPHTKEAGRPKSLSNSATMYALEDSKGRIYICTESGGLCELESSNIFDKELNFRHLNKSTGFPSDVALSAFENGEDLWGVANNKLVRLDADRKDFVEFSSGEFRQKSRFSETIPFHLSEGKWLLGLADGGIVIDVDHLQKSSFIPEIALTGIKVRPGDFNRNINASDTIVLAPSQRNITLYFAALDYAAPDRLQYSFCINDGTWNYIRNDHSVTLVDMKPRTYKLQIRSTNSDGVWVDNIRTISIIAKPSFWESTFAKIVYVLLALLAAAAIWQTIKYTRKIKERNQNLEAYLEIIKVQETQKDEAKKEQEEERILEKAKVLAYNNAFMQRVVNFIDKNYSNPEISLDDMAEATATSRSSLNRKMKEILGISPMDFVSEVRIQKACQMLKENSMAVNDVAYACGFSDPKYFSRAFKTKTGKTPSEFRNS